MENSLLNTIYNLILDPSVSAGEREYLMQVRDTLTRGANEQFIYEKLQAHFERAAEQGTLSETMKEFYQSIPIDIKNNPSSQKNTHLFSLGRKIALMAAIMHMIATASQTIAAFPLASLGSSGVWGPGGTLINGSPVVLPGGTNGTLVLTIIFAQFILVWLSFGFFDKGKFWSILLLIFGSYCGIWSLYQMFSGIAISGFFLLIAAGMMITAAIVKRSELRNKSDF